MNNDSRYDSEPTVFNSFVTFIIVAFLLFIALLYRQGNLVLLSLLVLCLVIGTKTWTRFSLSRVTCVISVDKQRAFPGEILKLKTILENAKFLPVWLRIQWPIGSALQPVESDGAILRQETGLLPDCCGTSGCSFSWTLWPSAEVFTGSTLPESCPVIFSVSLKRKKACRTLGMSLSIPG
jgi:hypothetical protein